jgi:peptidoglycan/xylan/chitin deacetylase (PgdA/CDA1 family)
VAFTFDVDGEEVWLVDEDNAAARPGVLSQGAYGPRVALPLIVDILRRHEVRATFFVPGRVADRYPDRVRELLAAGHEVAHHGNSHRAPAELTGPEELDELVRGRLALERLGADVAGYRAPSWDISDRTLDLLVSQGFRYSSNLMDTITPYTHPGGELVELPVHWILDDAAHFWFSPGSWTKSMASAADVAAIWAEESTGIVELGGLVNYTFHPQIIGRPGRLRLLESVVAAAADDESIWVATAAEVADHTVGSGRPSAGVGPAVG